MQLRPALRKVAKLKIGFSAVSGAGKTMSSIKVAYGLTGDYKKIGLVDTEAGSGDLYAHLGEYNVLTLSEFSPEKYIQSIIACEQAGMEVCILDGITPEWDFLLGVHSKMSGNSFTNWGVITPRHDAFINKILNSTCHIFTTVRRKTEYEINKTDGKTSITKVGLKEQTRENFEYNLTVNFEIGENHYARATKDRTELFPVDEYFILDEEIGRKLRDWANNGTSDTEVLLQAALIELNNASNMNGLTLTWNRFNELQSNETFRAAVKTKQDSFQPKKV